MRRKPINIAALLLISFVITACSAPSASTPLPGIEATLAVRTMVALEGVSYFTTPTPSCSGQMLSSGQNYTSNNSNIFLGQVTPVPSLTPMLNGSSFSDTGECLNRAQFVQDITFSDYSEVKPGQSFTKIWELRNVGDCTWSPDYSLVFKFGDKMGGLSPKPLGAPVKPGETIQVSVELVAPKDASFYQGNWSLQDNYGRTFSCGSGSRDYFWVSILVGEKKTRMAIWGGCGGGG